MKTQTVTLKDGTEKTFEVKEATSAINNGPLLEETGLRIVHVNAAKSMFGIGRSMTIAYQQINKSHVKVATSVCHTKDAFNKKLGTKVAVENFQKGATVLLPIHAGWEGSVPSMLRRMFDVNSFH